MNVHWLSLRDIVIANRKVCLDHEPPVTTLSWLQERPNLQYALL